MERGPRGRRHRDEVLASVALKRVISTPQEAPSLALFLASEAARTIIGQSINVDAGGVIIG